MASARWGTLEAVAIVSDGQGRFRSSGNRGKRETGGPIMATKKQDDAIMQELTQSREKRAQAFAQYLKERLIDYQHRERVWITSATEVGKLLGVSDVTANDWL